MRKFNKSVVLFGLIFCIMLISGCVKFTTTPITPSQLSGAQETQQATPSQATPSAALPSVPPSPSTTTPTKQITDITSVKCDGNEYNFIVKPKHSVLEISVPVSAKQSILSLKSEGIVDEISEIASNDGTTMLKRYTYSGTGGKNSGSFMAGWSIFFADIKTDNQQLVFDKVKEKVPSSYSIHGLNYNYKEQDIVFDYMCKIIVPKNTGRITLYSNTPEASFTIKGPAEYSGNGVCWTKFEAPAGEYKITWNEVAGYTAPGSFMGSAPQPITMTLQGEGHLKLGGTYRSDKEPTTGTIVVITNLPEATFTITGPASYSGSGTCWSQTNVPFGQYDVKFNDVPGYEIPFSSRDIISISSGFPSDTSEVEYKKIGEES